MAARRTTIRGALTTRAEEVDARCAPARAPALLRRLSIAAGVYSQGGALGLGCAATSGICSRFLVGKRLVVGVALVEI